MNEIMATSEEVARKLAQAAINIRKNITRLISLEEENGHLNQLFHEVRNTLINDLTLKTFADMYAQTVTYGLFTLRIYHLEESKLEKILRTMNPFLKNYLYKIFQLNADQNLEMKIKDLGIPKLVKILEQIDIEALIDYFVKNKKYKDPIIHFYEEFLHFYDPNQKIERGVFYTPDAVVSFIVRSVNLILKLYFDCEDGLADDAHIRLNGRKIPKIQILDPATGTGTFLIHIVELIYTFYKEKCDRKKLHLKWNSYVESSLLPRLFGFELLMTPYIIANLKLRLKLKETGYDFKDQRLGIYLTNTLEGTNIIPSTTGLFSKEDKNVSKIKMEYPISVVLGNPPYSGHSSNKSKWIDGLLRGKPGDNTREVNYFKVDGKSLGEKNPKWLNDDYVKFIRFGQWRIEKTGYGVLAVIANHSFIDNPTFRGMRQELMKTFTDIYILDLHGNTRRKEVCPDGSKDENIFDIKQGVCISFFIKNPNKKGETEIFKADLWGLQEFKYSFLEANDFSTIDWKKVNSYSPWYMFFQMNKKRWKEYQCWWTILDIFSKFSVGIMTGQDTLTIQDDPLKVQRIVEDIILLPEGKVRKKYGLKKDKRQWTYQKAKLDLERCGLNQKQRKTELKRKIQKKIVNILYRPFDRRYTFYTGVSRGFHERPRGKLMKYMIMGRNLGLIISRNSRPASWRDILITEDIIELGVMATRPGNNAPLFPLFLYKKTKNGYIREINFSNEFKKFIKEKYGIKNKPTAEDVLYYIYAILHSSKYRERYEDFLKIDFPRIPFTTKLDLFYELREIGRELVEKHLMKGVGLCDLKGRLRGSQDLPEVKRLYYTPDNKLFINKNQFFEKIRPEVYNFCIGGYQICKKWLTDRKGKMLSKNDIESFSTIVEVIHKTISLMERIDETIERYQGWPLAFI
ncbi:MAG: type ISP restriction/modification enzyme [Candidatus Hodarchaeota archaeon]